MRLALAFAVVLAPLACARADEGDAVPRALKSITEEVLQTHIRFLSSDDLEGRAAGFPGNERAVEYLVDQVKELGLKPAGEGGYTQGFTFGRDRKARNVLALLEGGDAALKAQTVVIGCHLDHVGRRGQQVGGQTPGGPDGDDIWNGADDNASGTSAVLAVARAFVTGKVRPKRSILFAWWNAEEAGLLGSRHWVRQPTRPIESIVYYLNLDMVGRNAERPMDMEGVKNAEGERLEQIITAACEAESLKITKFDHSNEAMFRSDGASFLEQGIPASMMFTSWHADYHKTGDHWDKIAYPNLAKIARSAFRIVAAVADLDAALRLNVDTPLRGKSLRIRGEDVEGKGAVRVSAVQPDSAFAKAGLQAGDVVIAYGGRPLPASRPLAELWRRAQASRFDEAVEVRVQRDGAAQTLQVTWTRN